MVEADQRAVEGEERLVDLVVAFVADRQTAGAVGPRQRALDHPAMAAQPLLGLVPFRAIRTLIRRRESARRQRGTSYALSAWSLSGHRHRCPEGRLIGGMASSSSSNTVDSWRLAPVRRTASGIPADR